MRCLSRESRAARLCWRGGGRRNSVGGRRRRTPPILVTRRWVTPSANPPYEAPNKKAAHQAPLFREVSDLNLRRFRGLFLHRAGIEALGIDVAVDEFDHGHRRVVAVAEAGLDDAGVAALPVLVTGRQRVEQLLDLILVAHLADCLAAH